MVRAVREGTREECTSATVKLVERYPPRPTRRHQCLSGGYNAERPCPYLSCRHHLAVQVADNGALKVQNDWEDMVYTCALDVADRGGLRLEQLSTIMGATREWIRQLEIAARDGFLAALRHACPDMPDLDEMLPEFDNDELPIPHSTTGAQGVIRIIT